MFLFDTEKRRKAAQLKEVTDRIQFFEARVAEWRRDREAAKQKIERGRLLRDAGLIARGEREVKDIDGYILATQGILEILEDFQRDSRFREATERFDELGGQFPAFKRSEGFERVHAALYDSSKKAEEMRARIEDLVSAFRGSERVQVPEPVAPMPAAPAAVPVAADPATDVSERNKALSKRIEERERKLSKYR